MQRAYPHVVTSKSPTLQANIRTLRLVELRVPKIEEWTRVVMAEGAMRTRPCLPVVTAHGCQTAKRREEANGQCWMASPQQNTGTTAN